MISDLTYQVVAHDTVTFKSDLFVDWAIEMIGLGYESDSLFMLASFSKSASHFEIVDYVNDTLADLGLEIKTGGDAVISCVYPFVKKIAQGEEVRENLNLIRSYWNPFEEEYSTISDFYLLCCAWEDCDDISMPQTWHWHHVDSTNIEKEVIRVAKDWIEKQQKVYTQFVNRNT